MAMLTVMRLSPKGESHAKRSEGRRLDAYQCTAGVWTIGYGHASGNPIPARGILNGQFYEGKVCKGLRITVEEADRLWSLDKEEIERGISRLVEPQITQGQFDALFSWTLNFNPEKLAGSKMLAHLNRNPNDPKVLDEMVRWIHVARAEGEPRQKSEPHYRRRLREACLYAGVSIPDELWVEHGIPWALNGDEIDHTVTPTVHQIIAGKLAPTQPRLAPNMSEVVSQPWLKPTPVVAERKAEPIVTIITDVPSVPAELRREAADSPGQVAPASPVAVPPPVPKVEAPPVVVPAPAPKPEPEKAKDPPKPKEAPVVQAKTVDLKSIPYGEIDTANPQVKNATDSRRITGMVLVGVGSFVQVLITRGVITSTFAAVFYDLSRDPVVVALAAGACIWVATEIAKRTGKKTMTTGMVEATTLLK